MASRTIALSDVCDLAYVARVTGINPKTLSVWANRRGKLSRLDTPRMGYGGLYSWSELRPVLAGMVDGCESHPVEDWPE